MLLLIKLGLLMVLYEDFLGQRNIVFVKWLQRKLELLDRTELRLG